MIKDRYCFLIFPLIFILTRIQYIDNIYNLASYLIFIIMNYIISMIFFRILKKMTDVNLKKIIVWIAGLIVLDQLLKIIVYRFDINMNILGKLLRIKQTKNLEQMAALNFLNIKMDGSVIIIFKILLIFIVLGVFFMIKNKNRNVIAGFILLMSAAIVTLIDSVFWGYTLDFICFDKLTCYDMKDFYVDIAIGFIFMEQFKKEEKK
ncbi:MAG: signal peptidase II [Lachnospiraceae bacterium]|nr:signal peptidase II [Lachnospiraceae bacterium]